MVVDKGIPTLLTVEEAGRLLRIGRTKAYAMTREWRETGGRSGLPVVDLGHVLRVPRQALEELIGAELTDALSGELVEETGEVPTPDTAPQQRTRKFSDGTPPDHSPTKRRNPRGQHQPKNQLDLFEPTQRTS